MWALFCVARFVGQFLALSGNLVLRFCYILPKGLQNLGTSYSFFSCSLLVGTMCLSYWTGTFEDLKKKKKNGVWDPLGVLLHASCEWALTL